MVDGFFEYFSANLNRLSSIYPKATRSELAKMAGREWWRLSEEEKSIYKKKAT